MTRHAGLLVLLAASVQATVVERVSLATLVDRSTWILRARCERTWAAFDAQTGAIWTHAELVLLDGIKGDAPRTMVVSEPGGLAGGVGMTVEGVPRYRAGEEAVVFLYLTPRGFLRTRGLGQGKFTVMTDPVTGRQQVRMNAAGAALVSPAGAIQPAGTGIETLNGLAVDRFLGMIRGILQRPRGENR